MSGILEIHKAGLSPMGFWATVKGVHLLGWEPQNAEPKGGGLFSDSPYKMGRVLISRKLGNIIETYRITIEGDNSDQIALVYQDLIYRLEEATKYFDQQFQLGAQAEPVWIKRLIPCESNPLYAYVVDYRIPGVSDPFHVVGTGEFDLVIEHTAWQTYPPGETETLDLSNTQAYGAVTWGNETPDNGNRFISSFDTGTQLTHLFRFDASVPSFSANLIATIPAQLYPNPVAVGDILYLGSNLAAFSSAFWELDNLGPSGITAFVWEYWNGAWVNLAPNFILVTAGPGPQLPDGPGQVAMIWNNPTDWTTTAINGVTALWIRLRVTGVGAPFNAKSQITQRVYRAPSRLVSSAAEVRGDLDALGRGLLACYGDEPNAFIIATRRASRGAHFTPFLSPIASLPDYGFAAVAPGALIADMTAPCGQALQYSVGGATAEGRIGEWAIANPGDYMGEFRCFVRIRRQSGGGAGTLGLRLSLLEYNGATFDPLDETEIFYNENATNYDLVDLGSLNFQPEGGLVSNTNLGIGISALSTAALDYRILDIVILPIDETAVTVKSIYSTYPRVDSWTLGTTFYLSSILPKEEGHAAIIPYPGPGVYPIPPLLAQTPEYNYRCHIVGDLSIERKREVYMFVLVWDQNTGDRKGTRNFIMPILEKVELYTLMRGAA